MEDKKENAGMFQPNRAAIYALSRTVICLVVVISLGTLLWNPATPQQYAADILLRTYVLFLGTVMAHEGAHGHLGRTRAANFWWARLALLPSLVPFITFRKTHRLHHAFTNIPDRDPDYFLKPRTPLEIPLRALMMPQHWFFWLRKRGLIHKGDILELIANYAGMLIVFSLLLFQIDAWRMVCGILPSPRSCMD
jgi:fatty acid desaturase